MSRIHTGPNPPLGNTVLSARAEDLVRNRGCRRRRFILDESNRLCSYELVDHEGQHFFLVARSTAPMNWRNVVSTQRRLVERAAKEEKPLVMYWPSSYNVFDPKRILLQNQGINIRADAGPRIGIEFLNWDSSIGIEWTGQTLTETWELCQKHTVANQRADLTTYR